MPDIKEQGSYEYTATSVTVEAEPGGVKTSVNYEGTVTGYGTVLLTVIFRASGPDAKGGTIEAAATGYMEDGEIAFGQSQGVFEECGKHQWRVRGIDTVSDGSVFLSDGIADLETRTLRGKFHSWE